MRRSDFAFEQAQAAEQLIDLVEQVRYQRDARADAATAGGRAEFLTVLPALTRLVTGLAFLRILEDFAGLARFLEPSLGIGFLADIGMALARRA